MVTSENLPFKKVFLKEVHHCFVQKLLHGLHWKFPQDYFLEFLWGFIKKKPSIILLEILALLHSGIQAEISLEISAGFHTEISSANLSDIPSFFLEISLAFLLTILAQNLPDSLRNWFRNGSWTLLDGSPEILSK